MNLLRKIEQLAQLHRLLCNQQTGKPEQLCRRLGMSKSKLYIVFEDLREHGADIVYSRDMETYYYENDFVIDIHCTLGPLDQREIGDISGGYHGYPGFMLHKSLYSV